MTSLADFASTLKDIPLPEPQSAFQCYGFFEILFFLGFSFFAGCLVALIWQRERYARERGVELE